jgi:hypothetical protein
MLDDQIIRQATEETLSELQLNAQRFEVEPALGASDGETSRQIRLFDAAGNDKAAVINFEDKNGNVPIYFDDIKAKIRKQIEALTANEE